MANEKNNTLAKKSLIVIIIHAILFFIFSTAHERINVLFSISLFLPYVLLFTIVPLLFATALLTKYARYGAIALLGILPAAFVSNIVNRFTDFPTVSVLAPSLFWKITYEASFYLILLSEAIAFLITLKLLFMIHNPQGTENEKSSEEQNQKNEQ